MISARSDIGMIGREIERYRPVLWFPILDGAGELYIELAHTIEE